MAAANKQRQPRLRASCDGCFLAKVKCSKARPICTRCLTCGIECRYSPSSRAGKPKASENVKNQQHPNLNGQPSMSNDGMMFAVPAGMTGWPTPPTSIDGSHSRSESISSGLVFLGVDNNNPASNMDSGMPPDMYGPGVPWTPPNDLPPTFTESPGPSVMPSGHSRSHSYPNDMSSNAVMGWAESTSPEMFTFPQVPSPPNMGPNYFSSPTATPHTRPHSSLMQSTGGTCTCFTVCLQSLQALHSASSASPPPFDMVLSLNRKAVEGCAAMLACTRCMGGSGTHTATMLLTTVLGTVTASYNNASQSHFHPDSSPDHAGVSPPVSARVAMPNTINVPGLGVSLGAYTVNLEDSRWLELEILARELRKLEEVFSNFRDVCAELSEDAEVSKAMIGYLGQSLGSTMQLVSLRKVDLGFR